MKRSGQQPNEPAGSEKFAELVQCQLSFAGS
jgi:hypothetical protein